MKIYLLAKDNLEAEGIRWLVESQMTGIELSKWDSIEEFFKAAKKGEPDLLLLDMDAWMQHDERFGELLKQSSVRWLGISSERIFQTAYRGLRYRAEDVLFRPFSPVDLIKQIQQIRFQIRSEQERGITDSRHEDHPMRIDYPDLFLSGRKTTPPFTMIAIMTPNLSALPRLYQELHQFPFTTEQQLFALSDCVLCIQYTKEAALFQEEYHAFLAWWKEGTGESLAIVINDTSSFYSLKETYVQTKQLKEKIFFEGYDIVISSSEHRKWSEMDPFLTPLEQRQWIEMLEKRDVKEIRHWVEQEFFTYEEPYPDPEMVRIRLTSVLAQVRRYMKSYNIQTQEWESSYQAVFQQIIRKPVIHEIVQELLSFITELLLFGGGDIQTQTQEQSLVERVQALIEANYWNAQWSLTACADALRLNKSTLSRRFSAESGELFRDVLHQVRIREAKRLLKETDLSLEEISVLTGYSNQSYFTMKFKQLEGRTPSSYQFYT
ncbi:helix-turn-helix domain-containing protein [Sporosarcina cyprini]|uniref:response regulator transcription factor n=1 Tax=Sporosarcina cyprini TaxID=2910523 RepID=UPI001EE08D61|nr:response regulator transcription factor [Sporosarcina cyprini]MCG3088415.1 helix-turn-helix domain-containing protein [Sporosarcina cyprini]